MFSARSNRRSPSRSAVFSPVTQSPDPGLVEFGCRWYDAQTGRWLSKDPIGLNGGMNLYEFCGGDALNMCDPCGCAVEIGLIGARAAAVLGVHASMSLLLNEKGRIGIKFKGGVGAGVEVGVKQSG